MVKSVIYQGATKKIKVIMSRKSSKLPLDLTGYSSIEAIFGKEDDTNLVLDTNDGVAVLSETGGVIEVTVSSTNSALLKEGERQDWRVKVTMPTEVHIFVFEESLDVKE